MRVDTFSAENVFCSSKIGGAVHIFKFRFVGYELKATVQRSVIVLYDPRPRTDSSARGWAKTRPSGK